MQYIALFADLSVELIDGSSIWLQSVAKILSELDDVTVHLYLRENYSRKLIVSPLLKLKNIEIFTPVEGKRFSPDSLVDVIKKNDLKFHYAGILVRGNKYSIKIAEDKVLVKRLWAYVLDKPKFGESIFQEQYYKIALKARFLIVQTEAHRALFEVLIPETNGKIFILPPMVPNIETKDFSSFRKCPPFNKPLKFIYSGKYSKLWNVESYFNIPKALRKEGVEAEITFVGDKIDNSKSDPNFAERIRDKLTNSENVSWLGGIARANTLEVAANSDFGLCWRSSLMDSSIEISTKFLEYTRLGLPVFINRSEAYISELGSDYPFFVEQIEDLVQSIVNLPNEPEKYELASQRCLTVSKRYSQEKTKMVFEEIMLRVAKQRENRTNIAFAGHDFKFIKQITQYFEQSTKISIEYDTWEGPSKPGQRNSAEVLEVSETIICEWCCANAVWYSKNKPQGKRLIIRLHRFEAFTDYPSRIEIENVDKVIVVSQFFKELLIRSYGWPGDKIIVQSQYVLSSDLDRKKYTSARKTLGLVGIVSYDHKRVDIAINILQKILAIDPSFRLRIRSRMPWEFPWAWNKDRVARMNFQAIFEKIYQDETLRNAVLFDKAGSDMAEWYRSIGYILSTSETEGCHTAVAEGMASGAIPCVMNWEGADSVYPKRFVFSSADEIAEFVCETNSNEELRNESSLYSKKFSKQNFDVRQTIELYESLIR